MKNIKGKSFLLAICLIAFCATTFKGECTVFLPHNLWTLWHLRVGRPQADQWLPADAWTGGKSGIILRTNNGIDWYEQNSGTTHDLNGACGISPSATDTTVWVVGDSGTILRTNDGGANWFQQNCSPYPKKSPLLFECSSRQRRSMIPARNPVAVFFPSHVSLTNKEMEN
jgi:photosystem II stability/assembly factor-like uncharacterized protein